jgi:hypothetical protein
MGLILHQKIFKGFTFSKKSDIYCIGMIMWKFTTDCKPFANIVFKILNRKKPKITEDIPECLLI